MSLTFAKALLTAVKEKSNPEKCELYRLGKILQVKALGISPASWKEKTRYKVCVVRLAVEPGAAMSSVV